MNKEKIISVGVVVLVLGAIATFAFLGAGKMNSGEPSVAKVNGVEITKAQYDEQLALVITSYKNQGIDTENAENKAQIEEQVLNDLINNELVNQGIVKAGITITDEQVQAQYDLLVTQAGGVEQFNQQLTLSNLTEAQLRENIKKQLGIQAYLAANIDVSTATATDEEAQIFYDTNVKGQENAPAFKDIVEQIKQQIIAQKQQTLINSFITNLRGSAEIETTKTN